MNPGGRGGEAGRREEVARGGCIETHPELSLDRSHMNPVPPLGPRPLAPCTRPKAAGSPWGLGPRPPAPGPKPRPPGPISRPRAPGPLLRAPGPRPPPPAPAFGPRPSAPSPRALVSECSTGSSETWPAVWALFREKIPLCVCFPGNSFM